MECIYKFLNKQGTEVRQESTKGTIAQGGFGWDSYLQWISEGGITDPWKTAEELHEISLADKLVELKSHLDVLSSATIPKSNSKNQAKMVARMVKLLRKESQGRASQKEVEELDQGEVLDNFLDAVTDCYDTAERWLEDNVRTLAEIENYNVTVDPQWPRLGE